MWTHSRHALQTLARCEVPARLRAKLDPEDLVQSALIKVQQADASFDGRSKPEVVESLRHALISALAQGVLGGDLNGAKRMLEEAGYVLKDGALRYPAGKKEMLAGI